jgi:thiol-disulfide isomerase/thioredoxin
MKALLSLIVAASLVSQAKAELSTDPRVLKLDGCTGFMVEGNYLFTAKHCLEGLGRTISFKSTKDPSKKIVAKLVHVTSRSDGPIVYYLPSDGPRPYKSFNIASSAPPMNSLVHTIGYPGGSYAITYGKVSGGNGRDVNHVSMRISPGNSGGPLLNEKDEVVGVAQAVDAPISSNNSYFGGWGITKEALYEAKKVTSNTSKSSDVEYKADVVIFTADWCPSCKVLEREMPVSYFNEKGLRVLKVKSKSGKWSDPDLVKEFKSKTGTDVPGLPTVWARGTDKYQTGYSSGRRLSLFGFLMRPDEYGDNIDLPPPPPPGDEPPAPTEEVINWENVSIIIAAKQTNLSYVRGKVASIALKAIKGPLARANAEVFEGKANLFFVDQRTQPNRYASFSQAAGVDPDPFYIIVLVQKQSLGLKSLIAGKVERSIKDKIPEGTPVEIIFERIHKASYIAITESLKVADQTPEEKHQKKKKLLLKTLLCLRLKQILATLKAMLPVLLFRQKMRLPEQLLKIWDQLLQNCKNLKMKTKKREVFSRG